MAGREDVSDSHLSISSGILQEPLSVTGSGGDNISMRDLQLVNNPSNYDGTGIQPWVDISNGHQPKGGIGEDNIIHTPSREENASSDTKQSVNTVPGTAPPSKTPSTPSDNVRGVGQSLEGMAGEEGSGEVLKGPVTATSGADHTQSTASLDQSKRVDVFVSVHEHRESIANIESELKSTQQQKKLVEEQYNDVSNEKDEAFDAYKTAENRNIQKIDELKSVTVENKETRERLKDEKEAKRQLERRMSVAEEELRLANEKIERLERENQELSEEVKQLSCQLVKEKKEKESLQRELNAFKRSR